MSLVLYQIGDQALFDILVGIDGNAVSVSADVSWQAPTSSLEGVEGQFSLLPSSRALAEEVEMSVSGGILNSTTYVAHSVVERLKSFGGRRNTPVIAFKMEMSYADDGESQVSRLRWFINYAVVTEVQVNYDYSGDDAGNAFDHIPVDITMAMSSTWKALSQWAWEYRPGRSRFVNPYDVSNTQHTTDSLFVHPTCLDEIVHGHYFFDWGESSSRYDPSYWAEKYIDGQYGGIGSDFVEFGKHIVFSDPDAWSANPVSMYAFTDLQPTGVLTLSVKKPVGYFFGDTEVFNATLDLSAIDGLRTS
jgi:hypothetical protein